jgi:chromate transporter
LFPLAVCPLLLEVRNPWLWGHVALVGYMQRDLVESRKWITKADYQEGLALAQLSPSPLAAQLAMHLGYVRYRVLGVILVGLAFIWPSFLMVVALGWLYTLYGAFPGCRRCSMVSEPA